MEILGIEGAVDFVCAVGPTILAKRRSAPKRNTCRRCSNGSANLQCLENKYPLLQHISGCSKTMGGTLCIMHAVWLPGFELSLIK